MMNITEQLVLLQQRAADLCQQTQSAAPLLGVDVQSIAEGTVLDFASKGLGCLAGGVRLAEICLGGMGQVWIDPSSNSQFPFPQVKVLTDFPLAACIGSQYAGWAFSDQDFFAMCSGTVRVNYGREYILQDYQLTDFFQQPVAIFECNQLPSESAVLALAEQCGVLPAQLVICVARTASLPGSIQVVARSIETALHKLHELEFDLNSIRAATGSAPLPPIPATDLTALGWTNDAILYGGAVQLWVDGDDRSIEQVLDEIPSSSSRDYGRPFLEIFERYDRDFYRIDKRLFSPASITIFNCQTGRIFQAGQPRHELLIDAWGK